MRHAGALHVLSELRQQILNTLVVQRRLGQGLMKGAEREKEKEKERAPASEGLKEKIQEIFFFLHIKRKKRQRVWGKGS